jgi:DNA invertase Pin-like site-specific DNA recombinase
MAFLYRRVSSADQARHGQSLEVQRQHTRHSALQRGWRVCGEFEDVASGARADRAGYQALLAAVRRVRTDGRPAAVVGAWLDRFGRSVAERARDE